MFTHRAGLRFSDTDAMGHVNNARFASLFEDARIAFLNQLAGKGWDIRREGIILARIEIDYILPLNVDAEPVEVDVKVSRVGTKSFTLAYELRHHGQVAARGSTVQVAYDYEKQRSRALSEQELNLLGSAVSG